MAKLPPKVAPKKAPPVKAARSTLQSAAALASPTLHVRADCVRQLDEHAKGLLVDKFRLDDELIEHPERYFHVSELLTAATSYRDDAKAQIDTAQARADQDIRHDAEVADEKITEPQVKALISLHPAVTQANAEYNAWRVLTMRIEGLRASFETRGKLLGKLVDLHGQNYFATATGGAARNIARDRIADAVRQQSDP